MRFWQYKATEHPARFAARLEKFKKGQLRLEFEDEILQGQIDQIESLAGGRLNFSLLWRAKKRVISKSLWHPEWVWEREQWNWHHAGDFTPILSCDVHVHIDAGNETGHKKPESGPAIESLKLEKFYQDKKAWGHGILFTKCLFFTTDIGEKGTLFQPRDPRNLVLQADGSILDPSHPDDTPPPAK